MKKSLLFLALLLPLSLLAQEEAKWLTTIRQDYAEIQKEHSGYDTLQFLFFDSSEGGQLTAYFEEGKLRIIESLAMGEMGKRETFYYFKDDDLFFIFEQNFSYNRPIFWDESMAEENGDTVVFDHSKTTVEENRYYFHKGLFFRWLGADKKSVSLKEQENWDAGMEIFALGQRLRARIEKER